MLSFIVRLSKPVILIIWFVSLVMYFTSPMSYDYDLCLRAFIMMIIVAFFLLIKISKRQVLTFDLMFAVAFIFTNFLYPVFLYPINANFSLFAIPFNDDYITKCSFLALLGFSSYSYCRVNKFMNELPVSDSTVDILRPKWAILLCSIIAVITIIFYGQSIGTLYQDFKTSGFVETLRGVFDALVFYLILASFYTSKSLKEVFHKLPLFFWILIVFVCVFQLLIGVRTFVMRYGLVIVMGYSYFIKRIKLLPVILLVISGMILMHDVGNRRNGSEGISISENEIINAGEDMIINNRALYALKEIADKEGYTYGKSMLMNVLSIVPYAQSIVPPLFGCTIDEMSSALINTGAVFARGDPDRIGLGTNTIADIYLSFGVLGVIVLMGALGVLMSRAEGMMYKSFGYLLIYALFFANAIYYPRAEFLNLLRIISWNFLFYYLINRKKKTNLKASSTSMIPNV